MGRLVVSNRSLAQLAGLVCLAGVGLRGFALPSHLADVDAVNLGRSLHAFDVFTQSPHFPGYPVLVALAKAVHALGVRNEVWAIALPGIALWPIAGALLYLGLQSRIGRWPAFGALAVSSLAPGAVLTSGWPASEGLGLTLLAAAVGLLCRSGTRAKALGALVLGLLLGVRLSWWPVVGAIGALALYLRVARPLRLAASGLLGIGLWLAPMFLLFDPMKLLTLGLGFSEGHMVGWGGTLLGEAAPGLGARAARILWGIWDAGLGAAWPAQAPLSGSRGEAGLASLVLAGLLLLGVALALTHRSERRWLGLAALAALPYLVWLVGFQNVMKPRHLLPLLPLVGAATAAGLARLKQRAWLVPALSLLLVALALPRARHQGFEPVPAVALERWLANHHRPEGVLLFAGQEARVLERYLPMYRVLRPVDARVLSNEAERAASLGVSVWVTTSAPGYREIADRLVPIDTFTFPHSVRPHESHLGVARYVPRLAPTEFEARRQGGSS